MDILFCMSQLSVHSKAIQLLLEDINQDQASWKPQKSEWSILEVINHLIDEENEDFRYRLNHVLSGNKNPWPKNTPQKWVIERKYNERDIQVSTEKFMDERLKSLEWLKLQDGKDFTVSYPITLQERLSAGDILSSWVAHDLLHLRQTIEIKYQYIKLINPQYSIEYAGDW
jgi:hypothetical protein